MSITIGTYTIKNIPSFFSFTGKKGKREKKYEKTNHLGNVSVVVSDRKMPVDEDSDGVVDGYRAEVRSSTDYYPFGMMMPGHNFNSPDYRFGFGGHEKINEVHGSDNVVDMGDRWLDVRLGRMHKPDPYAAAYPGISPYVYALNTPIQAVDPDGNLVIFVNGYHMGLEGIIGIFGNASLTDVGKRNYWGGLDDKFSERIRDNNRYYSDGGTRTAWSTAQERYNQGKKEGKTMLEKINSGDIKIKVDENGKPTETIKIVSHSQGSARAAGISNVLTEAGYTVEVEYNIASKQPGDIPETKADRRVQYGSDQDLIAPQEKMQGTVEQGGPPDKEGPVEGHMLENFKNIFNIGNGKDGYVAPRKDVQENGGGVFGIIMLIMIFLGGCKNKEEQLQCLEEQIAQYHKDQEYQNLKIAVADSIKKWLQQGLKNMISYKDSNSTWKIDEIIFNEDRSKLFGWLLQIDKEQVADIPANEDRDDILDYVEYFTGEKRNGHWYFYVQYMPRIWFAREDNNSEPYSFEYLSERAKVRVVEGGIFKKGACDMSYDYINEWIDKEGKGVRYKWHQEFLKSGNR